VAAMRYPQMRGVATDENATVAEFLGDETAAGPILFADDLVGEVRTETKNLADRPVAIDRIEILLAAIEIIVDQPFLAPVHRHHHAAAARVERIIKPCPFAGQAVEQIRRADEGGLHVLK